MCVRVYVHVLCMRTCPCVLTRAKVTCMKREGVREGKGGILRKWVCEGQGYMKAKRVCEGKG